MFLRASEGEAVKCLCGGDTPNGNENSGERERERGRGKGGSISGGDPDQQPNEKPKKNWRDGEH